MTATAGWTGQVAGPARWGAGRPVTSLTVRQSWRGALSVAAVAAGLSAVVVASHASAVADASTAAALEALAGNPAIRTLFGEPLALDDPGGFVVWRTGTALAVLLAVWGMLTTTRLLRGEEDAGRWALLMAGRVRVGGVVARVLAVPMVAMAVSGIVVFIAVAGSGATPRGALVHATGLALVGMFFVATGAVTAQVFGSRPAASGAATAVLLVSLLVRMVGDGVTPLGWLRWLSPYGLLALTRPYHDDAAIPLVVLGLATAVLALLAIRLAGRRDVGDGLVATATSRPARTALLGSPGAFAVRCSLRPWLGWAVGVGAYYLLIGLLARSMTTFLAENPTFADLAAGAGFGALTTVTGYVATLFALLAIPAGVYAAVRLAAVAAAERDRWSVLLFAQPVTRVRLLLTEAVVAMAGAVGLLVVAAGATWAGTALADGRLLAAEAIAGTLNVLPVVLLGTAAAVLALGWAPRAVAVAGAVPVAGGFLLKVVAESGGAPGWVVSLSPFAHLATVPHESPHWVAAAVMTALAVATAGIGVAGYHRRDLDA